MPEAAYDLVIRGGSVVDGSGGEPFDADVAIAGGVIAAIGRVAGRGREEIDARGHLVAPGFVDVHTHYDGQATWDQRMQPSSWHGVTTVVQGNCGVGFAPCKPADRDRLVYLMEGVEDLPFPVLTAGLPWNWESFPDYLDALEQRRFDLDIATQLPHAALRVHVMGARGVAREPATPDDIARMAAIAKDAVEAGALGFSTSRTLNHKTKAGEPTPTLTAEEDELTGIAMALAAANGGQGAGVLQVVSDFHPDPAAEFAMFRRIVEKSGRPLSFSLAQSHASPDSFRIILAALKDAVDAGLPMKAQVAPRAVGVLFGLDLTLNPFSAHATYKAIAGLPLAERIERLRDPAFQARLFAETPTPNDPFASASLTAWAGMYPLGAESPDYEPTHDQTIAALAEARGGRSEAGRARSPVVERWRRHPLSAVPELWLWLARCVVRDAVAPRHRAGAQRRRRARRDDLRRQLSDQPADALDARSDARAEIQRAVRGEAAGRRYRRARRARRSRADRGGFACRPQRDRL